MPEEFAALCLISHRVHHAIAGQFELSHFWSLCPDAQDHLAAMDKSSFLCCACWQAKRVCQGLHPFPRSTTFKRAQFRSSKLLVYAHTVSGPGSQFNFACEWHQPLPAFLIFGLALDVASQL